jgi:hypothetical protein
MPPVDELGLTEREKELRKWEKPYVYAEFPKMLFRGVTTTAGRVEYETRVVSSTVEEALAGESGWLLGPQLALDAEHQRQAAVGTAAAERAWADRRMSEAAQAEAAAVDAVTSQHLGEIPEQGRRPVRRKE